MLGMNYADWAALRGIVIVIVVQQYMTISPIQREIEQVRNMCSQSSKACEVKKDCEWQQHKNEYHFACPKLSFNSFEEEMQTCGEELKNQEYDIQAAKTPPIAAATIVQTCLPKNIIAGTTELR